MVKFEPSAARTVEAESAVEAAEKESVCRWRDCAQIFGTHDQMAQHVLSEHVGNAKPVRRGGFSKRTVDAPFADTAVIAPSSLADQLPMFCPEFPPEEDNKEAIQLSLGLQATSLAGPAYSREPSPSTSSNSSTDVEIVDRFLSSPPKTPEGSNTRRSRSRSNSRARTRSPSDVETPPSPDLLVCRAPGFRDLDESSSPSGVPDLMETHLTRSPSFYEKIRDVFGDSAANLFDSPTRRYDPSKSNSNSFTNGLKSRRSPGNDSATSSEDAAFGSASHLGTANERLERALESNSESSQESFYSLGLSLDIVDNGAEGDLLWPVQTQAPYDFDS